MYMYYILYTVDRKNFCQRFFLMKIKYAEYLCVLVDTMMYMYVHVCDEN